jgi:hypothetical protein
MKKLFAVAAGVVAALSVQVAPALAQEAENMSLIANYDDGGTYRNGTDMAFRGSTLLLGNLDQGTGPNASPPGGFRVMDIANPARPRQAGQFTCLGDQSDISLWGDIVVLSVDKPTYARCGPTETDTNSSWEGIRVISLSKVPAGADTVAEEVERSIPAIDAALQTDCGSHTNTIYPDPTNNRLLVYVLSYPLAGRYNPVQVMPTCNAVTHRKISVVEIPLNNPSAAKVLDFKPSTGNTIGCHDVTVFLELKLAAAACLTESQIWDLSKDPARPEIIETIQNPEINIHHSTIFSNDGKTLVIGDELGGAAASPGCFGEESFPHGGLFFYDVSDPRNAKHVGSFKLPQAMASEFCTAHLFNVVPRLDSKDVLVSSWYAGSTSVVDFTDPSQPEQIAYYIPPTTVAPDTQTKEAAAWSSYWYNGKVFANNFDEDVNSVQPQSRGLDVFSVNHPLLNKGTVSLSRLNPQLQEPFGDPKSVKRPKR